MDKRRTKRLVCYACSGREFDVVVEPSRASLAVGSVEGRWIGQAVYCPVCGGVCEEEKQHREGKRK